MYIFSFAAETELPPDQIIFHCKLIEIGVNKVVITMNKCSIRNKYQ